MRPDAHGPIQSNAVYRHALFVLRFFWYWSPDRGAGSCFNSGRIEAVGWWVAEPGTDSLTVLL